MTPRRKLIEVALPLEAINRESSLRKRKAPAGYPTTLHKWWAQRPLAACRAVLFASIVDDPSSRPDEFPSQDDQERERQRLFKVIEELIKWENTDNADVLLIAKEEVRRVLGDEPLTVVDPYCGGGSIPLEAQRLGLHVSASDLNPVAVLITKALTEIPARFGGRPPVNPDAKLQMGSAHWSGARGLAEDVRWYGRWMRDEAQRRIGHLYPAARLSHGGEAPVVAWLWSRTVRCPNPACGASMPLATTFKLSAKKGNERWVYPVVGKRGARIEFEVSDSAPPIAAPKLGRGARFRCLVCGETAEEAYVKAEGMAGRIGERLMAVVAQAGRGRVYVAPSPEQEETARIERPENVPSEDLPRNPRWFSPPGVGLKTYADLFTARQLTAVITFAELVQEAKDRALADSADADYANAVALFVAFAVNRAADYGNSISTWRPKDNAMRSLFAQQAMPMSWDFAEGNPFGPSSAGFERCIDVVARCLEKVPASGVASCQQLDAAAALPDAGPALVCSDPPYYDNIGYGDLGDFFYVWLRRALRSIYPDLFSTLLAPKEQELVANPYRLGRGKRGAEQFFQHGLMQSFERMRDVQHAEFPLTIFYAFKQAESGNGQVVSTGWDTMLKGLIDSRFAITGTWPMRTEGDNRSVSIGTAALASSIVLVCRPRPEDAPLATRREFVTALRNELPIALRQLQQGNIAPVDLAQAAIGPGMAVFSRHAKVVEADGSAMTVRTALGLINQALDEILAEQEGDFDSDTRFAVTWFEQHGMAEGKFGEADVLARAKNTSVTGLGEAQVMTSSAGKVRLLNRDELPNDWDPVTDRRPTAWEAAQHLTRRLETGGEEAAAALLRRLGADYGEQAKELAYRLYSICERKGWAQEALGYNALVVAWPEVARQVAGTPEAQAQEQLEV